MKGTLALWRLSHFRDFRTLVTFATFALFTFQHFDFWGFWDFGILGFWDFGILGGSLLSFIFCFWAENCGFYQVSLESNLVLYMQCHSARVHRQNDKMTK